MPPRSTQLGLALTLTPNPNQECGPPRSSASVARATPPSSPPTRHLTLALILTLTLTLNLTIPLPIPKLPLRLPPRLPLNPPLTAHQLHLLFFGLGCIHWPYLLCVASPLIIFHAADLALTTHRGRRRVASLARAHTLTHTRTHTRTHAPRPVQPVPSVPFGGWRGGWRRGVASMWRALCNLRSGGSASVRLVAFAETWRWPQLEEPEPHASPAAHAADAIEVPPPTPPPPTPPTPPPGAALSAEGQVVHEGQVVQERQVVMSTLLVPLRSCHPPPPQRRMRAKYGSTHDATAATASPHPQSAVAPPPHGIAVPHGLPVITRTQTRTRTRTRT